MDYFLQKVGGKSARQAVTLRRCTPAEAPAVFALQNEVRAAMPHPEQFVPDTLENITGYLRTGVCIGAWQQGRLGAYLILRLCGQSDENYAAFLGVPQSQWQHWANADSAVVHPDWRELIIGKNDAGQRVDRFVSKALPLLPPQITHLGATVSPDNSYSLHNAQASGFVIRCRREMYGGYDRYLLEKQL